MTRYCLRCGTQLDSARVFCPACGSLLTEPVQPHGLVKPKKKLPVWGVVGAGAVVLAALVLLLALNPFGNLSGSPGFNSSSSVSASAASASAASASAASSSATSSFSEDHPSRNEKPLFAEKLLQYYDLTAEERELFDAIVMGVVNYELEIKLDRHYSTETQDKVVWIAYLTLPECFWWNGTFAYATKNDNGVFLRPIYIFDEIWIRGSLSDEEYTAFKAWITDGKAALDRALSALPIHIDMTPYEIELAVYQWICDNIKYVDIISNPEITSPRTVLGAVVNGQAQCTGFTTTFQYILNSQGIDCLHICGLNSTGVPHSWNAVKLDGEWYHADVASDSTSAEFYGEPSSFYFFNRTDEQITWIGFTIGSGPYPYNANITCTGLKYNGDSLEPLKMP